MKYIIEPGNIAAICHVRSPSGWTATFIYLAKDKPPEQHCLPYFYTEALEFASLPKAVQNAVNEHFATVFALPVEKRGAYLKTVTPRVIIEQ